MAPTEDNLGNNIFPRPGFIYPEDGSEIVVVRRFENSTIRIDDRWIEPGTIGTVIGYV